MRASVPWRVRKDSCVGKMKKSGINTPKNAEQKVDEALTAIAPVIIYQLFVKGQRKYMQSRKSCAGQHGFQITLISFIRFKECERAKHSAEQTQISLANALSSKDNCTSSHSTMRPNAMIDAICPICTKCDASKWFVQLINCNTCG